MRGLLDDERLNGSHEAHICLRPERVAIPVSAGAVDQAVAAIETECQVWGGATSPLIPLSADGLIPDDYASILPGAPIDRITDLDIFALSSGGPLRPDGALSGRGWWGSQFAAALLDYRRQDSYSVLENVELSKGDPWRSIYAACLGRLPHRPSPELLRACYLMPDLTFEDFVRVDRIHVRGDLDDLLGRLSSDERLTPRQFSMVHLGYGNSGSTAIRQKAGPLPAPGFDRFDAGPNVIVLCSPNSVEDVALLWNLRGAHGDRRVLPIGLPVDIATPEIIRSLAAHPRIAHNGIAHRKAYVTSASLTETAMRSLLSGIDDLEETVAISPMREMLSFGYPGGWRREDVLVWSNGRAHFTPLPPDSHADLFTPGAIGDSTRMSCDVEVPSAPFPGVDDVRIEPMNGTFAAGYRTRSGLTARSRKEVQQIEWPSTFLMARSISRRRGHELVESEPGRACRMLLTGMKDLTCISNLLHAPLLDLLEAMAARHGFGWYKERLRTQNTEPDPTGAVPSTTDDLPDKAFGVFKSALGNSERATKWWLLWAEQAGLIIKGLPLQCVRCGAKQWIPVGAFAPPIICRGCGESMDTPFGDRPTVNFTYRISERLRRVYEQDAMGHLLVAHYFDAIFRGGKSGRAVGVHPGMEVRSLDETPFIGEADVLILTRHGEFIPIEVKRRVTGLSDSEIDKLEVLVSALSAPWCAAAVCEYAGAVHDECSRWVVRAEGTYKRIVLAYDRLLEPQPFWAMGDDPFALTPLSTDDIEERETAFIKSLGQRASDGPGSAFEFDMLHRSEAGSPLPD